MLLKPGQQALFWRLWSGACAAQGWMGAEKETRRKEVLQELGFRSLTAVDRTAGFDAVKARLLTLQDRLDGASEEVFPAIGAMRRHLHIIRTVLMPALGSLVADPDAYVRAILRDKFRHAGSWESLADHPDRGPAQIQQLLVTLTRCLYSMGWTAPRKGSRKASILDKPLGNPSPAAVLDKSPQPSIPGDPS